MSASSVTMRSLSLVVAIALALLSPPTPADPEKVARIGVLIPQEAPTLEEELRGGLRELGYVEGENIVIEWRRSTGIDEELRSLAADLARSRVELILTMGSSATRAALQATTLPIVFAAVGDPLGTGFAASLARPGGRSTGVSTLSTELIPKRLELPHQVVPRARRIVYLRNSSNPIAARQLEEVRGAARTLGVQLVILDARNATELDVALRAIPRSAAGGVFLAADSLFLTNKAKFVQAVRKARLPAIVPSRELLDEGLLMSYGTNLKQAMRHAAVYVDKILKGAKPSDLPVEQISAYELIIDLRVARELGIKVPQDLLLRANEVIRWPGSFCCSPSAPIRSVRPLNVR